MFQKQTVCRVNRFHIYVYRHTISLIIVYFVYTRSATALKKRHMPSHSSISTRKIEYNARPSVIFRRPVSLTFLYGQIKAVLRITTRPNACN